jgi:GNAT acetyltransferase-like protein
MIRYIEYNNINKQKWDDCISKSQHPAVFVYSWYLDAVCKDNWSALVLNNYEAVFPIASRSKYKINYVYQPFFSRYFGVYSSSKVSEKLVNEFLNAIPEKFKYIEFCLHESHSFTTKKFDVKEKKFQELDLNGNYETIRKGFSENTIRNTKKAIKAGLKIRPDIAPEKIVNLFRSTKGNELEIFKPADYAVLIKLMNTCMELKKGQTIAVYDGDKLCAAAFFMFSDNRFTFLKSGVTDEGKAKGAMHLLFDYFIRENAGKKYWLDFGGSSVESVAKFYKNFGAKDSVYLQVTQNNLPKLVKWVKSLKK